LVAGDANDDHAEGLSMTMKSDWIPNICNFSASHS